MTPDEIIANGLNLPFKHLLPGDHYVVTRPFRDYDNREHAVNNLWRYLGHGFLPYDDGLTIFLLDKEAVLSVRLQWTPDSQGAIIDHLQDYLVKAAAS